MNLEKKDWEVIKREAEMQMKNATITLALNQTVLDLAIMNIAGYKEDSAATSEDVQK